MAALDLSFASGESSLSVRRFSVTEGISNLFLVSVWAMSEDPALDLEAFVGQAGGLRVLTGYKFASGTGGRQWSGIVNFMEQTQAVEQHPGQKPLSTYYFRIAPKLWLLTQRRNFRIFQHLSIPDIVKKLLAEWSVEAEWKIDDGKYPKLEYKSQYGESDFVLMRRLLEEAGISFAFPDDADTPSKLTFYDAPQSNKPRDKGLHWVDSPNMAAEQEFVTHLRLSQEVRPGSLLIRDYDFRNPSFELFGGSEKAQGPEGVLEQYHYLPGGFLVEGGKGGGTPAADDKGVARYDTAFGKERAVKSLQADRTGRRAVSLTTNAIDLAPGVVFQVEHHPHNSLQKPLLITELSVHGAPGEEWTMEAHAVFADVNYRPHLRTPKPEVAGVQSATVVGPAGQEIHTDEFGRVRVQFPWDRDGKSNDDSSCWMRVAQGWAGTGFGMINLPRVGQEVLIGFLEGDPDQPLVVGRVFNAIQQVPYKLPENKTVSGWKTNSSPGGGGYNEIKLEDKAGLELMYVQAQRNLDQLVKNDATVRIQRHHRGTVAANQDLVVKAIKKELIESDDHLHVKGNRMQHIDQTTSLTVGKDQHEKVGNLHALEAGKEIHLKAGSTMVLEAGSRLTIKGPGGFIDIHSGGIDIVGTLVKINSGGSAGTGSGAAPVLPEDAQEAQPKDSSS